MDGEAGTQEVVAGPGRSVMSPPVWIASGGVTRWCRPHRSAEGIVLAGTAGSSPSASTCATHR